MYKVQKDSGDHSVKTLEQEYASALFENTGLSEVDTAQDSLPKLRKTRSKKPKLSAEFPDSKSNSDSDDSAIPRYINPARCYLNGQSNGSAGGSTISVSNDTSQNVQMETLIT